jgi:hypothetical protein
LKKFACLQRAVVDREKSHRVVDVSDSSGDVCVMRTATSKLTEINDKRQSVKKVWKNWLGIAWGGAVGKVRVFTRKARPNGH